MSLRSLIPKWCKTCSISAGTSIVTKCIHSSDRSHDASCQHQRTPPPSGIRTDHDFASCPVFSTLHIYPIDVSTSASPSSFRPDGASRSQGRPDQGACLDHVSVLTPIDHVRQVFFDPEFEPDVMLGPGALEYISDFATRHSASPDALLTMLQVKALLCI